mmetsp:Transcript_61973/g.109030  ORF Transcript_61973/g.109030 Transcript_61973/m.109030 type:complete len:440 (+) Transcript_61973:567-1886(+)
MFDVAQLGEQEVKHRTLRGDGAVELTCQVDVDLRLLALLHGSRDLLRCQLGGFQTFNQGHIGKDISRRVGKTLEQVILKLHQLNLVLLESCSESLRLLFKLRALGTDHLGQELVLETALSGDEVDQCALSSNLGLVVRIGELGLQVQLELAVVLNLLTAEAEVEIASFLVHRAGEHGVHGGVDILGQVLNDDHLTVGDGVIDLALPALLVQLEHIQGVAGLFLAEPLDSLGLGINQQRPALAVGDDGPVLNGDTISRKTIGNHLGVVSVVGQHTERIHIGSQGNAALHQIRSPGELPQEISIGLVERAHVGHEARGKHAITNQGGRGITQVIDLATPALILRGQATDQALSQTETGLTISRLGLYDSLLVGGLLELVTKCLEFGLHSRHNGLRGSEGRLGSSLGCSGLLQLVHQGFHLDVNAVVLDNVHHPVTQVRGGH